MPITPSTGVEHTALLGLGVYRPSRVVTNDEIVGSIESSDEWIQSRSGIQERRFSTYPEETVVTMAVEAGRDALRAAGVEPGQIGCVILATSTWFWQTPAGAPQVATALGIGSAAAFDISAGCAGFCHGVALASDMVRGGSARHVLVIGSEQLSITMDPTDRGVAFIFADGAGAVVVGPSDEPGIGPVVWGSDGSQHHVIRQEPDTWTYRSDPTPGQMFVRMEGQSVFRWAGFAMAKVAAEAVERSGITVDELKAFIPHQANLRITEALVRGLKLPAHVAVAKDIVTAGNTSAASVPLAMEALLRNGEVAPGDPALLIAFGAGLSYAGQVVALPSWKN